MKTAIHIFALTAFAVGLHAQSCDTQLASTEPGVIQSAPLHSAISNLANSGADVRIRVIQRMGTPTLDLYERLFERTCPSWQAPDGGRKNNLIVVMVSIADRKTGIYYGSQWSALQSQWPHIQSAVMAPRFRDADYAGGLAAGLTEIRSVITTRQSSSAAVVVQQASAPTDLTGLWNVMLWTVMLSGLGGLLWLAWATWRAWRTQREERLGAQQAALIAQQEASGLVADSAGWPDNAHAKVIIDAAVQGYSQLGMGAVDPAREDLTAAQYGAIRLRYEVVSVDLKRAHRIAKGEKEPLPVIDNSGEFLARNRRYDPAVEASRQSIVHHHYHDSVVPVYIPGGSNVIPVYIPEPISYDPPARHYDQPAPSSSYDSGGSSSWGSSDSGGGSSDSGSSSCDSGGGSSDW